MSTKWTGLTKLITAQDVEREMDRLFDRPTRPQSAALRQLLMQLSKRTDVPHAEP